MTPFDPARSEAHNPYAAPTHGVTASGATARVAGAVFKWVYLFMALPSLARLIFPVLGIDTTLVSGVAAAAGLAQSLVGALWIASVLEATPRWILQRITRLSPSSVVVRLLIPLYNLYWMFHVQTIVCDAVNGMLLDAGRPARAPKTLAVVAPFVHLSASILGGVARVASPSSGVQPLFSAVAVATWLLYMHAVDRARAEAQAAYAAE